MRRFDARRGASDIGFVPSKTPRGGGWHPSVAAAALAPSALGQAPGARPQPPGFLPGIATAAQQIEGSNANSNFWLAEHIKPILFGSDACDGYHRYEEEIALAANRGFNAHRSTIERAPKQRCLPGQPGTRQSAIIKECYSRIKGIRERDG